MKALQYFRSCKDGEAFTHVVNEPGKFGYVMAVVEITEFPKIADEKEPGELHVEWLTTAQVAGLLQVTTRTIQNYRDVGLLAFTQVGRVIRYKIADIDKFMEEHYIKKL